jgi:hypothetical protein
MQYRAAELHLRTGIIIIRVVCDAVVITLETKSPPICQENELVSKPAAIADLATKSKK